MASNLKPINQFLEPLVEQGRLPQVSSENARKLDFAVEKAHRLYRCYPRADADDPEAFAAAVAALLTRYPDDVIEKVTHPVDGIPATIKWRPVLAEVKDACEREMAPVYRAQERERRVQESQKHLSSATTPREHRPTYDDLKAKYGPGWGLKEAEKDTELEKKRTEQLREVNRIVFERECAAAGVDPAKGVSPALIAAIHKREG